MSGSHVSIVVKESPELVLELGEFVLAGIAFIVLQIVVHDMNGLGLEKLS